jgi:hypothetical protein
MVLLLRGVHGGNDLSELRCGGLKVLGDLGGQHVGVG